VNPVEQRIVISAPRDEVFAFVADMASRVSWMDHFLKDFRLTRVHSVGVGAGASFKIDVPFFPPRAEFQIVKVDEPRLIVEQGRVGRWGRTAAFTEWEFAEHLGSTELTVTFWSEPGIRWDGFKESFGARRSLKRQMRNSLKRLRTIFEERPDKPLARATIAGYEPLMAARYGSA
jgi:uncharacterized protein YndB with AHSA1/START domain